MKTAIISAAYKGGAGAAAYRLHCGLMKCAEVVPSFIQQNPSEIDVEKRIFCDNIPITLAYRIKKKLKLNAEQKYLKIMPTFPPNSLYEIATFPTTSYRLEDNPIVKNADIINLHWTANFINYPTFFRNIKQPIVWTLHDMNAFSGVFHYKGDSLANRMQYGKIDSEISRNKIHSIHKKKDITIVTPSQWLADISSKSEALSRYPHLVIPNGLEINNYPELDSNASKTKVNVNNGKPTILFVALGLDIRRKGFDLLSEALANISNTGFNLISVGSQKAEINPQINHIHFEQISELSKLNVIYSAADLTVIPSREDNLPNVMLESLINGTPVLGFGNSGIKEHIKTGVNGILVEDINVESLRQEILYFVEKKYSFDETIVRNYALENFSSERQTQAYLDLYKNILNK